MQSLSKETVAMVDKFSFERVWGGLEKALGITSQRNSLITSNISHLDTPRYKPKEIDFEKALKEAMTGGPKVSMARTDPKHLSPVPEGLSGVDVKEEEEEWNGFNWVNIDREMTRLSENDLMYRTASEMLIRKIALLKEIIREGGQ
jgi:flagellar basal-body rod protein FlgB